MLKGHWASCEAPFVEPGVRLPRLIEELWRAVGPTGRVITCAVYQIPGPGLELRVGYSGDHFHWTRRVADVATARQLARVWRETTLGQGFFELSV
jgi:hypothetical protein